MSNFDKDLRVGDVICAYHNGFHRITKIERRFADASYKHLGGREPIGAERSSLIYYRQVAHKNGDPLKKCSKYIRKCDAEFCQHALKHVSNLHETIIKISKLVSEQMRIKEENE